jgi:hypothetical protein
MSDREVSDPQDPVAALSYAAALGCVMVLAHTAPREGIAAVKIAYLGHLYSWLCTGSPGDHRRVPGRAVAVGGAAPISQHLDPEVALPADFQYSIPAFDVNCLR